MVMFYQFDLKGHRLEHSEPPVGYIGVYPDSFTRYCEGHEAILGIVSESHNRFWVFVDRICFSQRYSGVYLTNLWLSIAEKITSTTVHELIHLSTPQRLRRDYKNHEVQTRDLVRAVCPDSFDNREPGEVLLSGRLKLYVQLRLATQETQTKETLDVAVTEYKFDSEKPNVIPNAPTLHSLTSRWFDLLYHLGENFKRGVRKREPVLLRNNE